MDETDSPQPPPPAEEAPRPNEFYKRIGISPETLRPLFETKTPSKRIKALLHLIRTRLEETRRRNLADAATWTAVDLAVDTALNSTTPTLLDKLLNGRLWKESELVDSLKQWNISEQEAFDYVTEGNQTVRALKQRTFWKVKLPLAASILKSRVSRLYTDRDVVPWLPYEPVVSTEANRLKCELLTNLAERWVEQFAIKETYRQAQLQAGKYARVLAFVQEAWHVVTEYDAAGKPVTLKEGLRYNTPPIYRLGWDLAHPLYTLNTDTGCTWALYWRLVRAGEVINNPDYWNRDQISFGSAWFDPLISNNYFKEIYPCQATLPCDTDTWRSYQNDREKAAHLYDNNEHDAALFLTNKVAKLVPAQWGLGDYRGELWFRFVMANDDTVVFSEPLPACPALFLGWDVDESKTRDPSLVLEALTHQDFINNLVSQHRLTVTQNLIKIVWYDTASGVTLDTLKKTKAESHEFAHICYLPYDSRRFKGQGIDPTKIFVPLNFGYQDTTQLIACLNTYLSLMERMTGMSANEFGVNAPRVTTAQETLRVAENAGSRLNYTGSWADDFLDAMKRQFHRFALAFSDDEFTAHVTDATEASLQTLRALGFEVKDTDSNRKTEVRGNKRLLDIDDFVSSRSLQNRINNPQVALVMFQAIQAVAPFLMDGSAGGRREVIGLLNRAAQMAGVPPDFKFNLPERQDEGPPAPAVKVTETVKYADLPEDVKRQVEAQLGLQPSQLPSPEQMQAVLAQQMVQAGEAIQQGAVQKAVQEVGQGLEPVLAAIQQQQTQLSQLAQALAQNRDQDAQVAAGVGELQQALAGLAQQHQQLQGLLADQASQATGPGVPSL